MRPAESFRLDSNFARYLESFFF